MNNKLEAQWVEPVSLTCHFVSRKLDTEPSIYRLFDRHSLWWALLHKVITDRQDSFMCF